MNVSPLEQLWSWDDGLVLGVGKGHSGTITRVRISPDQRTVVSTAVDGSIFIWEVPEALRGHCGIPESETRAVREACTRGPHWAVCRVLYNALMTVLTVTHVPPSSLQHTHAGVHEREPAAHPLERRVAGLVISLAAEQPGHRAQPGLRLREGQRKRVAPSLRLPSRTTAVERASIRASSRGSQGPVR
jgi:hypothetical protein